MKIFFALSLLLFQSCVTLSGYYSVEAYDENGQKLANRLNMTAQGSGIYSVRNAFCSKFPKATIIIKDLKTGKELSSESPYKCR